MSPWVDGDQPGFHFILEQLASDVPFTFCKLNHGFWEGLANLVKNGHAPETLIELSDEQIDDSLGLKDWSKGGMVSDLLGMMPLMPNPNSGLHFVASLAPWPFANQIEGTPIAPKALCEELIIRFVRPEQLKNSKKVGFSGHEMKVAAITGGMAHLIETLRERNIILVTDNQNRALFDATDFAKLEVIEIDSRYAWQSREAILNQLSNRIVSVNQFESLPVVITSAGGALSCWLGLKLNTMRTNMHFVDMGGALVAYVPNKTGINFTKTFRRQLAQNAPKMLNSGASALMQAYGADIGFRDRTLVEEAVKAGVVLPSASKGSSFGPLPTPMPSFPIPFIENKSYDLKRIGELLALSLSVNHHANGGPLVALLERIVALAARLSETRRVVAVTNGSVALQLACGLHGYKLGNHRMRWVTSAFTFFSAAVGSLSNSLIIDSAPDGGFSLERLKALSLDSYDGVVLTNLFAQCSNWDDVEQYCRKVGKAFVVDNATGLLDRPDSALGENANMEIISAHHTKPWGVGECGFVICNPDEESVLRKLINYGNHLTKEASLVATNAKLSDYSAAAIIDRLERMEEWGHAYRQQSRRLTSLIINAGLGSKPLPARTQVRSPRAHIPFIHHSPVNVELVQGPVVIRKYYAPLTNGQLSDQLNNAKALYNRIFSLSNSPEMRLASDEQIYEQVASMIEASEKVNFNGYS